MRPLPHANLLLFLVEVSVDPGSDGQIPTITIKDVDEQPAKDVPAIQVHYLPQRLVSFQTGAKSVGVPSQT
jgi:hypothetical protein